MSTDLGLTSIIGTRRRSRHLLRSWLLRISFVSLPLTITCPTSSLGVDQVPATSADLLVVPPPVFAAARRYVSRQWPNVELRRWNPHVRLSDGEGSIHGKPFWLFSFEAAPPVKGEGLIEIEHARNRLAHYTVSLDEHGEFLGYTVTQ
jgi:hypothetical protein